MKILSIPTKSGVEFIDITSRVAEEVRRSKVRSGQCHIFVPHTTAGITINENADPSVSTDILNALENLAPVSGPYAHGEGNAAAHIRSTLVGIDKTIIIEEGELKLGTWQGIFFCEFDGPRNRQILVKILEDQK